MLNLSLVQMCLIFSKIMTVNKEYLILIKLQSSTTPCAMDKEVNGVPPNQMQSYYTKQMK